MEDAGVSPVAAYMLSPRLSDLTPLATLEAAGFQPRATMLVCNEGRIDGLTPREEAFARTMRHSTFQRAVERGAEVVWMPRLFAAKEVEDRRIKFGQAVAGASAEGKKSAPLGPFDRSRVAHWLMRMDMEFAPVASWLP